MACINIFAREGKTSQTANNHFLVQSQPIRVRLVFVMLVCIIELRDVAL
jgi:hypothetical protein